jgi:methyltransferase (TIGR00027 family)
MDNAQPSRTAIATAWLRAVHQVLDLSPRILEDPLAARVLGGDAETKIRANPATWLTPERRALTSHVVLRARFTEDRLRAATDRGVAQYLVLGAGLDTFAHRQPHWAHCLRIVELDHPATQRWKRQLFSDAGLPQPENLHYAAVDLEKVSFHEALSGAGIDIARPTFVSWLGVTMYLSDEAIRATLGALGACARGSEVVLSYMPPLDPDSPWADAGARMSARVASIGEPFRTFLTSEQAEARLREAGFTKTHVLGSDEARREYFTGVANLPPPTRETIAAGIKT